MNERPPVSVTGDARATSASDLLVCGSERGPRLTPAARHRLRLATAVVIVSVAAVAGGSKLQAQRAASSEARRLASLRQVTADGPYGFAFEADPPPALSARLNITFSLRNNGPRDVTVTHATTGEFTLAAPLHLAAQTRRDVVMHQKVDCTADTLQPAQPTTNRATSDSLRWPGRLQVTVATPRDTQTITLARPPYDDVRAAAICDWLRAGRPVGSGGLP